MSERQMCANCGEVYDNHGEGTKCATGDGKWFPSILADAIRNSRTANDVQVAEGAAVVDYEELADAFSAANSVPEEPSGDAREQQWPCISCMAYNPDCYMCKRIEAYASEERRKRVEAEQERDRNIADNLILADISEKLLGYREGHAKAILSKVQELAAAESRNQQLVEGLRWALEVLENWGDISCLESQPEYKRILALLTPPVEKPL